MATITGFTAARMQQIEEETVVDGAIVNGRLILRKRNSEEIDAGAIAPPDMRVVEAGTNLSANRPGGALAVYWKFSAGVNVGTAGANIRNAQPGDTYFVRGS